MKVLFSVQKRLEEEGHDVFWAGSLVPDPGDESLLAKAYNETRVLVTLDKDFGELAIVHGRPHSGIIRLLVMTARQQASICLDVLQLYGNDLANGAIITASTNRVRIRPPVEHNSVE